MTNEEITKLLSDHSARRASGKPFTDEEYAEADAEDKAKMDDYAAFSAHTWPSARLIWMKKSLQGE